MCFTTFFKKDIIAWQSMKSCRQSHFHGSFEKFQCCACSHSLVYEVLFRFQFCLVSQQLEEF